MRGESLNKERQNRIEEEVADIFIYLLLFSNEMKIDLIDAVNSKISKNDKKYPVEKAKGIHLLTEFFQIKELKFPLLK
jgi:dCTP diphosphatase